MKDIRLKDLPINMRTTEPKDEGFDFCSETAQRSSKASAIILQTFDALEQDVLNALTSLFPFVYSIGPLQLLLNEVSKKDNLESIGYNLWKEDSECLVWLDSKEPGSVIYVNFGTLESMNQKQWEELGWGLVNSQHKFLLIIRHDLVMIEELNFSYLPPELVGEINVRGLIATWCPQEEVLNHRSIGGYVTHCGWNSTIESLSVGVPMICLPFFTDQKMNCRYIYRVWEVGMEIGGDVERDEVEKAMEWKRLAEKATRLDGSSTLNLKMLVKKVLDSMEG
ncbi:hypothetical protein Vadar_014790 [Vaccinium darrowii]|uniref:Uncharacterized protein n=1 Tax=Vaccinium darrowii TaxID=229202 RepID=A0ACB7X0Q3_9ERIC|nr:hypothetical protein Vadar_014790 [Vaccinium darrowii]